jgi:hypothetical protein
MWFVGAEGWSQANEGSAAPRNSKAWDSLHRLAAQQIQAGASSPVELIAVFGDLFTRRTVLRYELYFAIQAAGNCIVRIGHAEPYPE